MSSVLALPRSVLDGNQVDDTVRDILLRPEFGDVKGTWLSRLRQAVQEWILARVADLFSTGAGTVLAWVLLGLAALGSVWFMVRMVRSVRGTRERAHGPQVQVVSRTPADWGAEARAQLEAGDLRGSVRAAYRWMLAGLISQGVLDPVEGRTVREYHRDLGATEPSLLAEYDDVARPFEEAWYADHELGEDEVRAAVATAGRIAHGRSAGQPADGRGADRGRA